MSAPNTRAGLLWRLAAVARTAATSSMGPAASVQPRALFASAASATPPAPAARRPPRPSPLSFAAASSSRNPFAGLTKVDLRGARFRLIDARGQVLGRLATHVATLLQGKDRPTFDPSSRAGGDVCVVVNADSVVLTGRKWERKTYRTHTGYPGGVKEQSATELWRRDPARLVEKAVAGMLPRSGAARRDRLRKLKVFSGADHPFAGGGALELIPSPPPARVLRDKGQGWPMPEGFEPMNPEAYARRMRGVKGGGVGAGGGVKVRPAGGEALPAFDDLLAAGEVEVVRKGGNGGGGGGGAAAGGK